MMCHCQVRLLKRARNRIVFGIVISNILGFLSFEYRSGVTGAKSCFSEQPSDSIGRSYPSARRLQGHWCQGVLPTLDMWNPRFQKRSHPAIVIFSVKKTWLSVGPGPLILTNDMKWQYHTEASFFPPQDLTYILPIIYVLLVRNVAEKPSATASQAAASLTFWGGMTRLWWLRS